MRHLKRNHKLGRKGEHRNAMLANMACSVIKHRRITTTVTKAKAAKSVVEKLITLGRKAVGKPAAETVHLRRLAAAKLRQQPRSFFRGTPKTKGKTLREQWRNEEDVVHILFDQIAPVFKERAGGYTRIIKLGQRQGDSSQLAILELVDAPQAEAAPASAPTTEAAAKA
jgi:large subunit ribosomal protein L17